jgi:hypothetical protein
MVKFTEYSIIIFLERWEEVGRSKRDKAIKISNKSHKAHD